MKPKTQNAKTLVSKKSKKSSAVLARALSRYKKLSGEQVLVSKRAMDDARRRKTSTS